MLHPVAGFSKRTRVWCGPSAVCIITGIRYTEAAALLRSVSGRKSITGIGPLYVRKALDKLGFTVRHVESNPHGKRTFARWIADRTPEMLQATYLLSLGIQRRHYVVVDGLQGGDNFSGGPVPLADMKHRRKPVYTVFEVIQTNHAAIERTLAELERQHKAGEADRKQATASHRQRRAAMRQALAHAERLGLVNASRDYGEEGESIAFTTPEGRLLDGREWIDFDSWPEAAEYLERLTAKDVKADPECSKAA